MSKQEKSKYNGYVYIIKIHVDPQVIYKIGTTNRTPVRRMLEIAEDIHKVLGYIPKMMLVREKQTKDNYKVEAALLDMTKKHKYILECNGNISGESELRKMDEHKLLNAYELCIMSDYPAEEKFEVAL